LFNSPRTSHTRAAASDLEFADDAVLVTPSRPTALTALTTFAAVAASFGLTVNFTKTKFMVCSVNLSPADCQPLVVNDHEVAHVPSFLYLGNMLTPDARFNQAVEHRLACASRAFGALQCLFRDRCLTLRTKRMLYAVCVLTTLLYGAECWATLKRDEARLDAFHHRCLRAILGVSKRDQVRNVDLRKRWGDATVPSDLLRCRRLQWLGHVARMPADRLPRKLLFGWLPHRRPAHGPRLRWKDRVQADLQKCDIREWFQQCQDRPVWRELCRQPPADAPQPVASVTCSVCHRTFKRASGMARHKCTDVRQRPIQDQPGARQCSNCGRWLKSAGGLAVHKCTRSSTRPLSAPQLDERQPMAMPCCKNHCSKCSRCFKSLPGFRRHNCHRGQRTRPEPETLDCVCSTCHRRFRWPRDLSRHRCRVAS